LKTSLVRSITFAVATAMSIAAASLTPLTTSTTKPQAATTINIPFAADLTVTGKAPMPMWWSG
jgi:hypothetical protein